MNKKLILVFVVSAALLATVLMSIAFRKTQNLQPVSRPTTIPKSQKADPKSLLILKKHFEQITKIGEDIEYFEKRSKYDFERELDLRIETSSF